MSKQNTQKKTQPHIPQTTILFSYPNYLWNIRYIGLRYVFGWERSASENLNRQQVKRKKADFIMLYKLEHVIIQAIYFKYILKWLDILVRPQHRRERWSRFNLEVEIRVFYLRNNSHKYCTVTGQYAAWLGWNIRGRGKAGFILKYKLESIF